ncbi:MAG: Fic family protein [Planctomycetes bacterium]|nr:Fic family protein [Planctomycetota bacterium]MBT4028174.1 Fic family protein [Planctomycetota bacterium]MBT4559782.1 Fic family protein [Planctomycetota bacterium]MBT5101919.1 Fic family protein [Planctomycetota bacterium]MBT5119597.1 Fic family protein [Planctomycetota bacterium]
MFKPRFTITNSIASELTRIERARGFLEATRFSEAWLAEMQSRAFLLEAHHTTHIEGTQLSVSDSKKLLAGQELAHVDPNDAQELLNYRRAFDFVSQYLNDGGPITEGLVREIHKCLVADVRGGAADPGNYRSVQNYVVNSSTGETVYTPPPVHDLPILMQELVHWLNTAEEVHPVLLSGIAQFQLVHIHPFLDGNGRVSRLLSTLCLFRAGYDFKRLLTISEYYDRNRPAFYEAIQSVRANDMDLSHWLEYFVEGLATQLHEVKSHGESSIRKDSIVLGNGLSARQSIALSYVLTHGKMSIADFQGLCPDVARRSLQPDLQTLVTKHVFQAHGGSSATQYVLV